MTIRELDPTIKEVIENWHVYGAESVINALVRACKNQQYLGAEALHSMLECAIQHEIEKED